MALGEYARKRPAGRSPEPQAGAPAAAGGRAYCVQCHAARQLHYDLRLEVDGVLKSWAVPQGPSLDPADKRLAVEVEDHPLAYALFEGNIPRGEYGAGSVMLWDRGVYEPLGDLAPAGQIARGDFKFRLRGNKLRGEFALVRMKGRGKGNEWLLIKKHDEFALAGGNGPEADVSVWSGRTQNEIAQEAPALAPDLGAAAPLPAFFPPMLAEAAGEPPAGSEWVFEIKWDGMRVLAFLADGRVRLYTRQGREVSVAFPELAALARAVWADSAVLDGEVVVLDREGRPSFQALQPRILASGGSAAAQLAQSQPAVYFAFDLCWLDGRDLRGMPLERRTRLLGAVLHPGPVIRRSEQFEIPGSRLLEAARAQRLEGIVAKRRMSSYVPARSRDWLKIKIQEEADFLICGYTAGERDHFGALILGFREAGKLRWAGNVGSGFDQATMADLRRRLDGLAQGACPFEQPPEIQEPLQWVRPELVCAVRFNQWTAGRHLRAPVFSGLRVDLAPVGEPPPRTHLRFRNLDKIWFPDDGITKREVLDYYDAVAHLILPHLKDRPLSLRRFPDGIQKEGFFQKRAGTGLPRFIRTETVPAEDGEPRRQALIDDRDSLLYLVNLGCIDHHPWLSRLATLDHPDFLLVDLDPASCSYARIVEAALEVRRQLDAFGLVGFPKTTGGDGFHIYVPLAPVYTFRQVRDFAEVLARLCAAERPDLFTLPRAAHRREPGRVYFDYLQNGRGKTISAPYSVRPYAGAPVATPLEWREVMASLDPRRFPMREGLARFERTGDLFQSALGLAQRLEPALERWEQRLRPLSAGGR